MRNWTNLGAFAVTAAVGFSACTNGEAEPPPWPTVDYVDAGVAVERPVNPPPLDSVPDAGSISSLAGSTADSAGSFSCGAVVFPSSAPAPIAPPSFSPLFSAATTQAEVPPPPISGGTLLTSADGLTLIAADPDRDAVYLIDIATRALVRRVELSPGDEPGRVVQDKTGTIHVALRGGRGIVSFAIRADAPVRRSELCDLPRGIAYDSVADRLYLACAEGALVQVNPSTGKQTKKLDLGRDLRDVIVRDKQQLVTRFRSAELLEVDVDNARVIATHQPANTTQTDSMFVTDPAPAGPNPVCGAVFGHTETRLSTFASEVAWRTLDVPGHGVAMLHQRAAEAEVRISSPGGYGGNGNGSSGCGPGIVRGAISFGDDAALSIDVAQAGLFVDMAIDSTGALIALANPGGSQTGSAVMLFAMPTAGEIGQFPAGMAVCQQPTATAQLEGQPTALSFATPWLLAVQEREPAAISFYDTRTKTVVQRLDLAQPTRTDTGHALFHATTSSGLACASCHAEAGDDGHVWTFEGIGPRRTQNLRGGILGSEPFHWNGDMQNFSTLVDEVFVRRMNAPTLRVDQADALSHWIDRQPVLHSTAVNPLGVARGKQLFESTELGCTTCHSGARLSNNASADVGTGGPLQVPSLRAVSFRAPFMHDGCAKSLADRFAACGGGDKHGHTSQLQPPQIADLVAYLQSL